MDIVLYKKAAHLLEADIRVIKQIKKHGGHKNINGAVLILLYAFSLYYI
jgi:hypothetical protein